MTPVLFHFLTSEGAPIGFARVEIRLTRSDYEEEVSGVIMPRLITAITGMDGKILQELMPCNTRYHVTVYDTITEAALHYHFYVPVLNNPDEVVRLQDLIVDDDAVLGDVAYDEAALLQILTAKAATLAARDTAVAAALAADLSADFADGVIDAAVTAQNLAQAAAATAVNARDIALTQANEASDSALLAEDRAAASLASKNAAAISAAEALAQAGVAITQASAAVQSALDADASEAVAVAARDAAAASEATAVSAKNTAVAAKDITVAARDVTLTARDVAIDKAAQLSSQLFAFNEIYLGKFAVAPTVDGNGGVLKVGAIYENTVEGKIYQWESDLAWHPYDEESQAQLNSAILSASNAAASAGAALASQNASATSEANALAYRNTAAGHATTATTKAAEALASADAADLSEAAAASSAGTATTKAAEASQSAADAAVSAAQALAGQIPSDWTQVDAGAKDFIKNKPVLASVATSGAKADVGLGNVDNTSDINKPVSTAQATADNLRQLLSEKDTANGYPGLSNFKIALKNAAGTVVSYLTSVATVARTWTFPDKDGTVAMLSDITGTNSGVNTGDETAAGIRTKLGATALTGSNTGDETNATILSKLAIPSISGTNTGDETGAGIRTKLGIVTLSGSNTGDQTLASLGIPNVENTTDLAKPVSTATQNALNLKANITYVDAKVAALVDASPAALDTLKELATALGNDANFATTMTNSLAAKLPLAGGNMTGSLNTRTGTSVAAITSLNGTNAPIGFTNTTVPFGSASYTEMMHGATILNGQGYIQHISIGAYRPGNAAWGGAVYMAIGGADANATEGFFFNYGGVISHSSGTVSISGNATYATSAGTMPFSGLTAKPTAMSAHGITDFFNGSATAALTGGGNGMTVNSIAYVTGMNILGQTDGALYGQAYNSGDYQHQIYGDYRTGQIAVRGRNAAVWTAWRTVIDSGNIAAQNVDGAAKVSINTDETYAGVEYLTMNRGGGGYVVQYNTAKLHFTPSTGKLYSATGMSTGPNVTWGANIFFGNVPTYGPSTASVATTNGNVHIDPATGTYAVYLGFYSGTGGTKFGDGASNIVASVTGAGVFTGSGAGLTGNAAALSIGGTAGNLICADGDRDAATKLPTIGKHVRYDFVLSGSTGTGGSYAGVMTFAPWDGTAASTGSCSYQMAYGSTGQNGGMPHLRVRNGIDSTWNTWYDMWHAGNLPMSVAASPSTVVMRDANGYIQGGTYMLMSDEGINGGAGTVTSIMCKRGDNYYRSTQAASVRGFLAYSGNLVYTDPSNMAGDIGVAAMMRWKNYGNSHVIFDASNSTSPSGSAVNSINAQNPWSQSYPTLMGWNGSGTYGVRVDSARVADTLAAFPHTINRIGTTGLNRGSYGSISVTGVTNTYAGIDFTSVNATFMSDGGTMGVYVNDNAWAWTCSHSGNFTAYGNVTAYSDERLKTNWRDVQEGFVALWAGVKHGTYDRLDSKITQVGLSAQGVQAILPHAVSEGTPNIDGETFLTLNYGGAAAVATVQLAIRSEEHSEEIRYLKLRLQEQDRVIDNCVKLVLELRKQINEATK
jgi:hypothetical protein